MSGQMSRATDDRQLQVLLQNLDSTLTQLRGYITDTGVTLSISERPRRRRKICPTWWPCKCKLPQTIYKYMLLHTVILQVANVLALVFMDSTQDKAQPEVIIDVSAIVMITIQLLNLVIAVFSTVKLSRQMYWHNISKWFFLQNYMATVLLFSGIYTMTYRIHRQGWHSINLGNNSNQVFLLYFDMMTLSISTATLCGASNISPVDWYNSLILSVQMLLSYMYFASIMSIVTEAGDHANQEGGQNGPQRQEAEDKDDLRVVVINERDRLINGGDSDIGYQRV